jgi:hypothetical protein
MACTFFAPPPLPKVNPLSFAREVAGCRARAEGEGEMRNRKKARNAEKTTSSARSSPNYARPLDNSPRNISSLIPSLTCWTPLLATLRYLGAL